MNRNRKEPDEPRLVLSINGGSSSFKFAVFELAQPLRRRLGGSIERIGRPDASFRGDTEPSRMLAAPDHAAAVNGLATWLEQRIGPGRLAAVGHRIVHGGPRRFQPELVTPSLIRDLRRMSAFDPQHLPAELDLVEAFAARYPGLPQVVCFDTEFHRDLPAVARRLAIPRRYDEQGVRRYGFHGLSYAYLMDQLPPQGRILLAHLGTGASMAAVRDRRPVDCSMAFTPASGLVMGTRSGDLDPGLGLFLAQTERMGPEEFNRMINARSGLLGISGVSSDMRDLLAREADDPQCAEAVAVFCYQAKKWLGALTAALGGLDILVFTGGIGEHQPIVRTRICAGMEWMGIELDGPRNEANAGLISRNGAPVSVRVIRTDEELMIARAVARAWEAP